MDNISTMFPFLTTYDPPGSSEGSLDPLGLYQIADQLAMKLVPAVRERMQRIRFLTAMALGSMLTEGLEDDPRQHDASPYLVWEWIVVEALMRTMSDDSSVWGVPGTLVAARALGQHGYLDARSYLKTPRVFGFHGVYKRLAIHLGIVDMHLGQGPNSETLVDAWARDLGLGGLEGAKPLFSRWRKAVIRSLNEKPPCTKPGWSNESWKELANAFAPSTAKTREKQYLHDLLNSIDDRRLGALPSIWRLQAEFDDNSFSEEYLHTLLEKQQPDYAPLIRAIRCYEAFARSLQDAFDLLKAEAAAVEAQEFVVTDIAREEDFKRSVKSLHERFEAAYHTLCEVTIAGVSLQNLFGERFRAFAEPISAGDCALALCTHHEGVQRTKSSEGKRPWFDRIGPDRIYIRQAYCEARRAIQPDHYVHDYRGQPIRRFYIDLL